MNKILIALIFIIIIIFYIFSNNTSNTKNNIKEKEKFVKEKIESKQQINKIPKIKYIETRDKKSNITTSSNIQNNNNKIEINSQPIPLKTTELPPEYPEYKDFVPITTSKVGEYEISIISDEKVERNPNTPPSVPFLVSGKINGENFTITLPAQQIGRTNAIAYKDKNGKTKIKEIPINDLAQNGILNIGEIGNENSNNSDEEENTNNIESTPQSGSFIPPMAPGI